jgi:hypothetical protein
MTASLGGGQTPEAPDGIKRTYAFKNLTNCKPGYGIISNETFN